jgi:hypothetical protein
LKFGGKLVSGASSNALGYILIIFSSAMFLGALFAWVWLPEVQDSQKLPGSRVLPSQSLEELAEGRKKAEARGQIIGFRRKIDGLFHRKLQKAP